MRVFEFSMLHLNHVTYIVFLYVNGIISIPRPPYISDASRVSMVLLSSTATPVHSNFAMKRTISTPSLRFFGPALSPQRNLIIVPFSSQPNLYIVQKLRKIYIVYMNSWAVVPKKLLKRMCVLVLAERKSPIKLSTPSQVSIEVHPLPCSLKLFRSVRMTLFLGHYKGAYH